MATLHQYFETDFSNTVRIYVAIEVDGEPIESVLLVDFAGQMAYLSCYVEGTDRPLEYFLKLSEGLKYGKTQLTLDGRIYLPAAKLFPGQLHVVNSPNFELRAQFHGDPTWISYTELQATRRVFIYSETNLTEEQVLSFKERGESDGHAIQFRSVGYVNARTQSEKPKAFICHDSHDKDEVARKIAMNLERMLCPVWYDEYSLNIGDNLRDKIEQGIKTCQKCILVLSPNFFSNNGWTKKEFDSIFSREVLEGRQLVLPVWFNVTREQVYEYSPSLVNVKGANWNSDGEEEVCRKLYRALEAV